MFQAYFGKTGDANEMLRAHGGTDGITKKLATDANVSNHACMKLGLERALEGVGGAE
jgi:hypothetical protein